MNGKNGLKKVGLLLLVVFYTCVGVKAQLMPPPDPFFELDSWGFDSTNWLSDLGYPPVSFENLANPPSFDGNALQVDSTNAAWLQYNIVESDGTTNLSFNEGTLEIWVLPDWNSGTGPGDFGRIIDVGAYGTNNPSSWWSLYFTPDGSRLNFSSETNGVFTNYLSFPISWDTNTWHLIDLTYRFSHSELYVDGLLVTNGSGSAYVPSPSVVSNGFFVGSDYTGLAQSRAQFDDMATYNYALNADEATNDYTAGEQLINPSSPLFGGGSHTDGTPISPGSGGGGTNDYYGASETPINYGTNLWIAQVNISSNNLMGIASNTVADVEYEIQSWTNLATTNWVSQGFILGSETTNWTSLNPLPVSLTNNLFVGLRSWEDSDAIGIPDWWQLEYFSYVGVDPNALDSAGDGWTIYQKFKLGINPGVFYTPVAPQGLTASYNEVSNNATVGWLPSRGNVASYTLEKTDNYYYPILIQDISISATNTSYSDNLVSDTPDYQNGNNYDVSYRIIAVYTNGNSSAWSPSVPLQQLTVSAAIEPGTNGITYLAVWGLQTNAASVQLVYIDEYAEELYGDASYNYTETIPVSTITNGFFNLPASSLQPLEDGYGISNYEVYTESVDRSGNISGANFLAGLPDTFNFPFYDGRAELKQNLIFQLRAAPEDGPFHVFDNLLGPYDAATNYAYAGLMVYGYPGGLTADIGFDPFWPFRQNYIFRNFVFSPQDSDTGGNLTTGISFYEGYNNYYYYVQLSATPTYQFQPSFTNDPALLATNATRWLYYDIYSPTDGIFGVGLVNQTSAGSSGNTLSMVNNAHNWFGLPYLTVNVAGQSYYTGNFITNVLSAGTSATSQNYTEPYNLYTETAQPLFQTVEYDFWKVSNYIPLPGNLSFAETNQSELLLTPVASSNFKIAGYAKLAVTNAYSGAYGYLGQYFDQAYQTDTNGVATTNVTGILSPYGNFFATEPGATALVTMPDVDTGERGTCMVYAVSLQLDANHDGVMDTSFSGPDNTSEISPFVFWANNNYDRWAPDPDDDTNYQDDVFVQGCPFTIKNATPDCNYKNAYGQRVIPDTRDLEDFARLWVCGVTSNLLSALPEGSTITLSWGDVGSPNAANPTIDLFAAADADGGIGYLTDETVAAQQTNTSTSPYIQRLGPGQSIQLNANSFSNNWAGNHFIWCGVSNGTGQLTLTIADANNNVLVKASQWIQIKDIRQLFERWTVGDSITNAPLLAPQLATDYLPDGAPAFQYSKPQNTNTPYILFVHGWNMQTWEKDCFAATAFKRLYWSGYQGRFGSFRWPTGNGFGGGAWDVISDSRNFDNSESNAWGSATGLLSLLTQLNAEYPKQVYLLAHSMGNVVAGEALRLAGTNRVVKTYIAAQAAIVAQSYDNTVTNMPFPSILDRGTPNRYANYYTNSAPCYFNGSAGAGKYVNFFNINDYALNKWVLDQETKPDHGLTSYPGYHYSSSSGFYKIVGSATNDTFYLTFPTSTYQIFAFCDAARSFALGAQGGVRGAFAGNQLELDAPPFNFGPQHLYHSAQFRSDFPQFGSFWTTLLIEMGLKEE